MNVLKRHGPMLRIFLIILLLLLAAGGLLASCESKNGALKLDSTKWQWSPAASMEENKAPVSGWLPYTEPVSLSYPYYWLRIPLSSAAWKDPALFMLQIGDNRIFADHRVLYENDLAKHGIRANSGFYWHMVRMPLPLPDHVDLLLRNGTLGTQNPQIELGEREHFVSRILHKDLDNLVLGSLLIFSSLISIGMFVTHRDKLYLYFALLAFAGGYASLVGNQLIKFVADSPWVGFLQETSMPWATFAVVGALEQVFPGINRRSVKLLRRFVLTFSILATLGAFVSLYFYTLWLSYLYTPVFLGMFVISYWTIWKAYRIRKDLESIWVMAGFTSLVAIAFVHVVRYWLPPGVYELWPQLKAYLMGLPEDLIYLGLFAFVICLIRVIIYRYTAMNRQLTELNRSLEQLVEARSEELQAKNRQLEEANEQLSASWRESAEAMAESMMLEERHRITGAIHDTVGHTLSAAIIQLEAARRLMPSDRQQAEEKLETSQRLARTGLEDIRHSVRLLRENDRHFDLPGAIGALVRETEQTAECQIVGQFGPMPSDLSILQKRLLFQAMQEGLAHGIKNGRARYFSYEVTTAAGWIRLLLISDGEALPEQSGIGLRALGEHVDKLGGKLRLVPLSSGAALTLSMPVSS